MSSQYHHGDLRNSLIEAGIKLVHEDGMQALSIRRVAAMCGVSHAAPRHHFPDKECLLLAMQKHVTDKFTSELQTVVSCNKKNQDILHELGKAYLRFFLANPYFYNLIFNQMNLEINLLDVNANNYPPFDIFKNCAVEVMKREEIPAGKWMQNIAAMWSMVHGITSLAVSKMANPTDSWYQLLETMMSENFIFISE